MRVVYSKVIRILFLFFVTGGVSCQDGYAGQNNIQMKQMNGEQMETITGYSTNVMQNNPNSQVITSGVNVQFHSTDDSKNKNMQSPNNYNREDRARIRKIFRIKNPFQQPEQEENENKQSEKQESQDSKTGASEQYAAMQYSLPPEEFLQQLRANNQLQQQQQQQQQQVSTPASTIGYTATPQPQYYSTVATTNFNTGNQQKSPTGYAESNNPSQTYNSNLNNYQYSNGYSFGINAIQSTPSSVTIYLSTKSPNQYVTTPSSTFVSTLSPIISSSNNLPSFISSTISNVQSESPNYHNINRYSAVAESNSFNYEGTNRGSYQNMHVNHYDNSANGVQYPINTRHQYQNEFVSSTQIPISSTFSDANTDSWQNPMHYNLNNVPSSRQEFFQTVPQNFLGDKQHDISRDTNLENNNDDTHRIGSMTSANNLFLSFARPDYKIINNINNDRDNEQQQSKQTDVYSHGDYGWKLDGRKPIVKYDVSAPTSHPKQPNYNYPANSNYLISSSRYVDSSKNHNYDQASRLNSEKLLEQEFAKAAAKAHENMQKQQQVFLNSYSSQNRYSPDILVNSESNIPFISHDNIKQSNFVNVNPSTQIGASQSDLITSSPYYFTNSRETSLSNKFKQIIDDKGSHNIIKSDDSSEASGNNSNMIGFNSTSINRDPNGQNIKQNLKSFSENYYNDKNMMYNLNIRTKSEPKSPSVSTNRLEHNYDTQKQHESSSNVGIPYSNPHPNLIVPFNYLAQSTFDKVQSQNLQRPQNEINPNNVNNFRLNDIPQWLTQAHNSGNLRFSNTVENGVNPTTSPLVLNQNVDVHQLDVAASILNKLIRDKPADVSPKLEYNPQIGTLTPTINGLKVVNPYNLDLRLVAEILKGRLSSSEINPIFHNQISQPSLRWDASQLQQLMLKNDNIGNFVLSNDGMSTVSPFFEINNNGHLPYQGVKYSRSQEEEESLVPIADSSHTHSIGAVIEQDDMPTESRGDNESDETEFNDDNDEDFSLEIDDEKSQQYSGQRVLNNRYRQPNSLNHGSRYHHTGIIPKMVMREPFPLLQPPPLHNTKGRRRKTFFNRRQRANKLKFSRIAKREPLLENEDVDTVVPTLLRPPPPVAEDRVDAIQSNKN